jgi:uncharacterized protein YjcR
MSKIADLAYDIEQLYIEGYSPISIAAQLGCPVELVYDWLEQTNLDDMDAQDWDELEADEFDRGDYFGA